jgi:hypothetical protein
MSGRVNVIETVIEKSLTSDSRQNSAFREISAFIGVHLRLNLDLN